MLAPFLVILVQLDFGHNDFLVSFHFLLELIGGRLCFVSIIEKPAKDKNEESIAKGIIVEERKRLGIDGNPQIDLEDNE